MSNEPTGRKELLLNVWFATFWTIVPWVFFGGGVLVFLWVANGWRGLLVWPWLPKETFAGLLRVSTLLWLGVFVGRETWCYQQRKKEAEHE